MTGKVFTAEHEMFRDAVRAFLEQYVVPYHFEWEKRGIVPREGWREAGKWGLLCPMAPEKYGGLLAQDAAELLFEDVRVPAHSLLGGGALSGVRADQFGASALRAVVERNGVSPTLSMTSCSDVSLRFVSSAAISRGLRCSAPGGPSTLRV